MKRSICVLLGFFFLLTAAGAGFWLTQRFIESKEEQDSFSQLAESVLLSSPAPKATPTPQVTLAPEPTPDVDPMAPTPTLEPIHDIPALQAMNPDCIGWIATRPRAERFGSHGLFTDEGVQVDLKKVSQDLNEYKGNVWTVIISLRREDAERLGFDHGSRWRDMLRTQTHALAENFKIPIEHLKWFAAFHDESFHPHVHMIVYSSVENEGYLSKKGVHDLRSEFARDIFAQDLLCTYQKQTQYRDELRRVSREKVANRPSVVE